MAVYATERLVDWWTSGLKQEQGGKAARLRIASFHTKSKARPSGARHNTFHQPAKLSGLFLLVVFVLGVILLQRELLRTILITIFQISEQPFVTQIERVRILPVVVRHLVQAFHHVIVPHLDRQLAPAVKATRGKINRPDDASNTVGQDHLSVQLEMLELMDLDSYVVHDAQPADTLNELLLLERVWRASHDMDLQPTARGSHQALNDNSVLIALVLNEDSVIGVVDELSETVPPVGGTPDEVRTFPRIELLPAPVGLEAVDDLLHFMTVVRHHGVVASLGEVLRCPVQRLDECLRIIHHH